MQCITKTLTGNGMVRTLIQHMDWLLFLALVALFLLMPEIDLMVSGWFYSAEQHLWPFEKSMLAVYVYKLFRYAPFVVLPVLLGIAIWSGIKLGYGQKRCRVHLFLILSLVLGPGALVHTVFKEGFDRARPRQVVEFGGAETFTPAFVISDNCKRSCKSFVSGHAAMGFWIMALAWVARRRYWLWLGLAVGVVASVGRVVQGGHFLSDTLFAGFVCYFVYRILSWWLLGNSRITGEVVEQSNTPWRPAAGWWWARKLAVS